MNSIKHYILGVVVISFCALLSINSMSNSSYKTDIYWKKEEPPILEEEALAIQKIIDNLEVIQC